MTRPKAVDAERDRIIKFIEEQRDYAHEQYAKALENGYSSSIVYYGGREQSYRDMFTFMTTGKRPQK